MQDMEMYQTQNGINWTKTYITRDDEEVSCFTEESPSWFKEIWVTTIVPTEIASTKHVSYVDTECSVVIFYVGIHIWDDTKGAKWGREESVSERVQIAVACYHNIYVECNAKQLEKFSLPVSNTFVVWPFIGAVYEKHMLAGVSSQIVCIIV